MWKVRKAGFSGLVKPKQTTDSLRLTERPENDQHEKRYFSLAKRSFIQHKNRPELVEFVDSEEKPDHKQLLTKRRFAL